MWKSIGLVAGIVWAIGADCIAQAPAQSQAPVQPQAVVQPPIITPDQLPGARRRFDGPPVLSLDDLPGGNANRSSANSSAANSSAANRSAANRRRATAPRNSESESPFLVSFEDFDRSRYHRLTRAPEVLGDFFFRSNMQLSAFDGRLATSDLPLGGGYTRANIADNNRVMPSDRIYFTYHHFENAVIGDNSLFNVEPLRQTFSVDRYAFGFERAIFNEGTSLEIRGAFSGEYGHDTFNFQAFGGKTGNVFLAAKQAIYATDSFGISAGLGIDLPVGSDVSGAVNGTPFTVENKAVHLQPFVGMMAQPDDLFWVQLFTGVDVPVTDNTVTIPSSLSPPNDITEQTIWHTNLSFGTWLFHESGGGEPDKGVALLAELHHTTTLNNAESVTELSFPATFPATTFPATTFPATTLLFSNLENNVDLLNATLGLHGQLGQTSIRIGVGVPLRNAERQFDTEIILQLNRNL
jgi:hypothetical protein